MKKSKRAEMFERIAKHGENIRRLFDMPEGTDTISLCKVLRRLENKAEQIGLDMCNVGISEEEQEKRINAVKLNFNKIMVKYKSRNFDSIPFFVNLDPRGYALKIKEEWIRDYRAKGNGIETDWGGYGIIAPDLTNS